jgi:hypothetical protein
VLAVAVWVLGIAPPAWPAVWLDRTHHWPPLLTVGAFLAGYLPILTTGMVALFAHAAWREEAAKPGPVEVGQRRRDVYSTLGLMGALAGFGTGGVAVVIGVSPLPRDPIGNRARLEPSITDRMAG